MASRARTPRLHNLSSLSLAYRRDLHGKKVSLSIPFEGREVSWNIFLSVLLFGLIIWYALTVNGLTSGYYRESLLRGKISSLTEENGALLSQKTSGASLGVLESFAKRMGLVEQKKVEYIFDQKNIAQVSNNLVR